MLKRVVCRSLSGTYVDASGVSLLSGGGTLVLETHDSVRVSIRRDTRCIDLCADLRTGWTGCHDGLGRSCLGLS